jgi:dihydropteroate synthase
MSSTERGAFEGPSATAAPTLRLRDRTLTFEPRRPLLMGVLNASPESFYDGGGVGGVDELAEAGERLVEGGAAIVDVGGQSGVTHRPPVPVAAETERVVPLIERLAGAGALVSVDTWSAAVAAEALAAGAAIVNDPSGLAEPELAAACAEAGAALVVTHTRATPKVKSFPAYEDVVADLLGFLRERIAAAVAAGVPEERIVVDPGLDLAKTPAESLAVLRRLSELGELGRPVLLAASRKDFVGALTGRRPADRLGGTLAAVAWGVDHGAAIVRTHDPPAVADFLAIRAAIDGAREVPANLHLDESLRRQDG